MVVGLYKVTTNTQLMSTESLLRGEIQGWSLSLWSIFDNQSSHRLVSGVFLFCWFTDVDLLVGSPVASSLAAAHPTRFFSRRHVTAFFYFRNTRQHFSTTFGGHFKQWNPQEKCKNTKLSKGHLFTRAEQESSLSPYSASTGSKYVGQVKFSLYAWPWRQIRKYGIHE